MQLHPKVMHAKPLRVQECGRLEASWHGPHFPASQQCWPRPATWTVDGDPPLPWYWFIVAPLLRHLLGVASHRLAPQCTPSFLLRSRQPRPWVVLDVPCLQLGALVATPPLGLQSSCRWGKRSEFQAPTFGKKRNMASPKWRLVPHNFYIFEFDVVNFLEIKAEGPT